MHPQSQPWGHHSVFGTNPPVISNLWTLGVVAERRGDRSGSTQKRSLPYDPLVVQEETRQSAKAIIITMA